MQPISTVLSPQTDRGMVDLCRTLERKIRHPWELKQLPFGWILVVYFDSGVGDHPLRQDGGREDGKCALVWYERKHEVVGIGATPAEAAQPVILDGKGLRLRAIQVVGLEDRKRHLVFKSLDTGQIIWPTARRAPGPQAC